MGFKKLKKNRLFFGNWYWKSILPEIKLYKTSILFQKLDDNSGEHSRWEHDLLFLRQQLQQSASRDMQYGIDRSAETLAIEGELAQVQQRAAELHRERQDMIRKIQILTQRHDFLAEELRSSPISAASDSVSSKKKLNFAETDDSKESSSANEVKKSTPPAVMPKRPQQEANGEVTKMPAENMEDDEGIALTLGDISEADDRVKKFYGIIPKEKAAEIKTVRMVKRDSKERSISKRFDESGQIVEVEEDSSESSPPPEPLPRGNYQNLHDFLQDPKEEVVEDKKKRGQQSVVGYESSGDSGNFSGRSLVATNGIAKPNFKLGDYYKKKSKESDRPSSTLSAHERLFGSSRENSMSPPASPGKSVASGGGPTSSDSGVSPMMSPIFKSATAKQIAEEIGKTSGGSAARKRNGGNGGARKKQRSHTISGGNPAIMEALEAHQNKVVKMKTRQKSL